MKRFLGILAVSQAFGAACGGARSVPPPAATPAPTAALPSNEQIMAEVKRGNDAYKQKDWDAFLASARAAAALSPENPDLRYRVARGLILAGKTADGIAELDKLAAMHIAYRLERYPELEALAKDPAFEAVRARMAANVAPVGRGESEWKLAPRDLLIESIAHDPKSGEFLLSAVHARKILRVTASGTARDFVPPGEPGWGYFGIRADAARGVFWVGYNAMPQVEGFREADTDRGAVLRMNIHSGAIEKRYDLSGRHVLADLTVARNGDLWVSDSVGGGIYRVGEGGRADALEEIVPPGHLRSPQGLAFTADEKRLFVADYAMGLYVLDVASRKLLAVAHPDTASTYGIDGLVAWKDGLIAVQNGIQPHRVVHLRLDPTGGRVASAEILDLDDDVLDPTHGVVVGDQFHYVATSQWRNFDDAGKLNPEADTTPVVVRRLNLP